MIILESCVTCGDKNYTADQLKKGIWHVTIIAFVFCASVWPLSMAVPQVYARIFSASKSSWCTQAGQKVRRSCADFRVFTDFCKKV